MYSNRNTTRTAVRTLSVARIEIDPLWHTFDALTGEYTGSYRCADAETAEACHHAYFPGVACRVEMAEGPQSTIA